MQEQINQIISENIAIDSVGTRDIFYNNRSTKTTRSKVDEHFHDLIVENLSEKHLLTYLKLSDVKKRSVLIEALILAENAQNKLDEDSPEGQLAQHLELYIITDTTDNKEVFKVWNNETKDFKLEYLGTRHYLGDKAMALLPKHMGIEVYNPDINGDDVFTWTKRGSSDLAIINTYKHPSWRTDLSTPFDDLCLKSKKVYALPDSARLFFEHLFPDEESRHYVFNYLYHALTERNGCQHILLLKGDTGSGKTMFASTMLRGLFGESNFRKAHKNFIGSNFNKLLENKRILFMDEVKVTYDTYATVKLYANDRMNIERKGVDADNDTELFLSFIASTNTERDYYLHFDDRRSSVIETTEVKLESIWTEVEIKAFLQEIRSDKFLRELGLFLLSRSWVEYEEEVEPLTQFKSPMFYKIIYEHLSLWEKTTIKVVEAAGRRGQEQITIDSILIKIENHGKIKFPVYEATLLEFLRRYSHEGEYKLGEIVKILDDGEECNILKIDPHFLIREGAEELEDESGEDLL